MMLTEDIDTYPSLIKYVMDIKEGIRKSIRAVENLH